MAPVVVAAGPPPAQAKKQSKKRKSLEPVTPVVEAVPIPLPVSSVKVTRRGAARMPTVTAAAKSDARNADAADVTASARPLRKSKRV